ncbi:MAG: hypothetical protein IKF64_08100 [Eubacterium sp.]|nr:hypothetical protein [Eubacterium sp.]
MSNIEISLDDAKALINEVDLAAKNPTRTIGDVENKAVKKYLIKTKDAIYNNKNSNIIISGLVGAASSAASTAAGLSTVTTTGLTVAGLSSAAGGVAVGTAGGTAGLAGGALAGSAVVPVVGTIIGAGVGLVIGGLVGKSVSKKKTKKTNYQKHVLYEEVIAKQNNIIVDLQKEFEKYEKMEHKKDEIIKRQEYIITILSSNNELKKVLSEA